MIAVNIYEEACHLNLINGPGSMSVCLEDLIKAVVQKGGNAIIVTKGTMDRIHVSEPIFLASLVWVSKVAQL